MCVYARTYVCVYARVRERARARVRVCVRACACVRVVRGVWWATEMGLPRRGGLGDGWYRVGGQGIGRRLI